MAHNRTAGANKRSKSRTAKSSSERLPGLRWVPVPLAMLMAALGWVVLGGAAGQHASAEAAQAARGFDAGGLQLNVDTMMWMSNDMTGQGPVKTKTPSGFKMPSSMMPGMQLAGNNRLRVEFSISNISSGIERYYVRQFRVVTKNGDTYGPNNNDGSTQATSAYLKPGFGTVIDLYYDLPAGSNKNLSIQWTHGGSTVTFPVNTNGALPAPHIH